MASRLAGALLNQATPSGRGQRANCVPLRSAGPYGLVDVFCAAHNGGFELIKLRPTNLEPGPAQIRPLPSLTSHAAPCARAPFRTWPPARELAVELNAIDLTTMWRSFVHLR